MIPFETSAIPPMPPIYRDLVKRNPGVALVDAPLFGANEGQTFSSLWGYWQSIHRGKTSAGYPGLPNLPFEAEVVRSSPFQTSQILRSSWNQTDKDAAWLWLTAYQFDHVILHQGVFTDPLSIEGSQKLKTALAEARSFEDGDVVVFDREKLKPPQVLTWLPCQGFRGVMIQGERKSWGVLKSARFAVYQPGEGQRFVVELVQASGFRRDRFLKLFEGKRELARWVVKSEESSTYRSPPIRLSAGFHDLRFESDGDDRPKSSADRLDDSRTPYSVRIGSIQLRSSNDQDAKELAR